MSDFTNWLGGEGFGAMRFTEPDLEGVDAVVLPVPYDSAVSYKSGAKDGPRAIIDASRQVELYDPEWDVDCERLDVALLNEVEPDISGPEEMVAKTEAVYDAALEKAGFVLMLGGDHSLTTAAVRTVARRYEGSLTVVQFDAHADLRDKYQGSPYSHACVMRRAHELAPIVQAGIRNVSKVEKDFMDESGHPVFMAWDIAGKTDWIGRLVDSLSDNVYITFDLDGFDPAVVPGVGTPEPGGLGWRDATEAIRAIGQSKNIVGADIMELKPLAGSHQSEFVAAKLAFKTLAAALLLK